MNRFWRRLLILFRRGRLDRDLEEEMRVHLEMKAEAGGGTEEARYAARRQFGNILLAREDSRDMWAWRPIEELMQDLRYALRMLRSNPGFTVVAAVSLALGIGANTAIFSLVNAALLRPLPYPDADRLVAVWEWNTRDRHIETVTGANYADWMARNHIFEDIGFSWDQGYTFTDTNDPEAVAAYTFSCNLFPLLGAKPLYGRTFAADECQAGKDHVVVLSHKLWQRRFAADRGVVGRAIELDHQPYTVIGVMPAEFSHPSSFTALWTPLAVPADIFSDRKTHALRVIAKLKRGITMERAQAEMDDIARQLATEYPNEDAGMGVRLWPFRDLRTGDVKTELWMLQAAVLLMLLIACANVGNLLLARASAREREVAVRLALGAGRGRLLRQFLAEGITLAFLGGMAGIMVAYSGVGALAALLPTGFADLDVQQAQTWINIPVLAFAVVLSAAAGALFGAAPAIRLSTSPSETLKSGGRGFTEGRVKMRMRSAMLVSQIAVSLVLLIGAGLLVRSFLRLQGRDPGYRIDHVLTLQLLFSSDMDAAGVTRFLRQVTERVEALPGVRFAGATSALSLTEMDAWRNFTIPGQPPLPYGQQNLSELRLVTPHYFQAMGLRLLKGRYFDERDRLNATGVAIINETLARRVFRNEDPIGRQITVADAGTPEARRIVGVVGDTRHHDFSSELVPQIYRPFYQAYWPFAGLVVQTSGDPLALAKAVRQTIASINKDQPMSDAMSMEQRAASSMAPRRADMILLGLFAAIALLLTVIGIYGVMAYSVSRRTHEIGIRMALGAREQQAMGMVLGKALGLTATGIAIGLTGAVAATRLMQSLLVDISATDAATFVCVSLLLGAVGVLAAYVPARRASRVDPMVALRYE